MSEKLEEAKHWENWYKTQAIRLENEKKFFEMLYNPKVKLLIEKPKGSVKEVLKGFCHVRKTSGELVRINVYIGNVSDFKGGVNDSEAIKKAKEKVDEFIISHFNRFL